MNILIGLAFAAILLALGAAGVSMVRGGRKDQAPNGRMMRALALRVAISVTLFLVILAAWRLGWIHPTGVPVGS